MEFVINNWYLFLGLVVILYLLLAGPVNQYIYGIKSVNPSQAIQLINRDSGVVLDVCESQEFNAGHIPKAINIPAGTLDKRIGELEKFKEKPIVISCRSGNLSLKGAVLLRKHGYKTVYTLAGGLMSWQKENLPLEK